MKVRYTLECEPMDEPPRGYFASGDDAQDAETEQWIARELHSGNEWAWCIVTVRACFDVAGEVVCGVDRLHGCSYESRDNFIACNDYYADMKASALADLRQRLESRIEGAAAATQALRELEE